MERSWENPDPQELGINWGPRNINYKLTLTDYTGGGVDVDGLAENTETPDNDPAYPVAPLAIDENDPHVAENPFFERSSNLTISAFDQFGANPITKSVRIRQIFYSLVATGTEDYYYQGLSYTINIKSNTAWKATFGGDETIFSSRTGTSGSGNTTAGESFRFTISPSAPVGASATVTFSSADDSNPRFLPQTFTIIVQNYDQPNSYIVAPGAMQPIPVSKVYRVWKLDRDLGDVDLTAKQGVRGAKLLWQDETGLIAGVDYLAINGGTQDIINVRTNTDSKKGNAVVAFTIDGEVYWSWHIWVTDYDPETTYTTYKNVRFMDRNLGAMGDNAAGTAANAYEAYGLYYEWGRKDPFPRAAGVTNSSLKTIFDELGSILTINNNGIVSQMAPAEQNLAPAINNPMIYYAGGFANNSWYGQMLDIRANLWADALKTDFDPCPKGWKVASSANLSGLPMLPDFTTNRRNIFHFARICGIHSGYRPNTSTIRRNTGPTGYVLLYVNIDGG